MPYTDDPAADWDAYCIEQEKALELYPICGYCGERIMDDYLYNLGDCLICESCMEEHFREPTENFIEI